MSRMNPQTLEEQIAKRADERVQKRITQFRSQILVACNTLFCATGPLSSVQKRTLAIMASNNDKSGWPKELWTAERDAVTSEVLSTMNELQRVLLVKGGDSENEMESAEADK